MSPYITHVSVAVFTSVTTPYWPLIFVWDDLAFLVTPPVGVTVTCPAPSCMRVIFVPVGNATEEFRGIVNVIPLALDNVINLPWSVRTAV